MAAGPGNGDGIEEIETGVATRTRPKTKKPSNYKVLMLNDDYTPMEFVVLVLQQFFSMSIEDATRVMLQVHQQGVAVCGVFTYEVAETKVTQVIDFARENQHPLQCTLEKAVLLPWSCGVGMPRGSIQHARGSSRSPAAPPKTSLAGKG